MGRTKGEGPKNLVKVLNASRFQKVIFTKGSTRLPYLVYNDHYADIVARFEGRGFKAELEVRQP